MREAHDMEDKAKTAVLQSAPWRRGIPWYLVGIEGGILAAVGIYVLVQPDNARDIVRQLVGAILLITAAIEAYACFRNPTHPAAPYRLFRSGVGVAVGLIVTLEPVSDYLDADASRFILGLGLIGYGLIGLAATVLAREESGIRIGSLITGGLAIVLGIAFLSGSQDNSSTRSNVVGAVLIVFGVLLLAYAFYLYRLLSKQPTGTDTEEAPPPWFAGTASG
jgi:uncharacterized membrane protein HdeD (DUF308 family)